MSGVGKGSTGRIPPDLQAALERLDRAARRFASAARGEFAGRAAAFIDEVAARLERETRGGRTGDGRRSASQRAGQGERADDARRSASQRAGRGGRTDDGRHSASQRTGRGRHRAPGGGRASSGARPRSSAGRKLYRDPERAKIAGVCAGIAKHLGAEVWVVRCVAVTGLIFMPSIVFPAYWILYFVSSRPPAAGRDHVTVDVDASVSYDAEPAGSADHTSPAPELGPMLSPRRSLRGLRTHLMQAELRLRRMESHVTSGQYELQKELNELDGGGAGARG